MELQSAPAVLTSVLSAIYLFVCGENRGTFFKRGHKGKEEQYLNPLRFFSNLFAS